MLNPCATLINEDFTSRLILKFSIILERKTSDKNGFKGFRGFRGENLQWRFDVWMNNQMQIDISCRYSWVQTLPLGFIDSFGMSYMRWKLLKTITILTQMCNLVNLSSLVLPHRITAINCSLWIFIEIYLLIFKLSTFLLYFNLSNDPPSKKEPVKIKHYRG